ncbi:MAG: hypothetical protein C0503_10905 [Gemmatimonas sp.]|nr:hypothetical protein [Gemmatimonas sp.]
MRRGSLVALLCCLAAGPLAAQAVSGTRVGVERPAAVRVDTVATQDVPRPPITPRRAFFSSLVMPGSGQAALDRPYAGGVFLLVETLSLTMLHRAGEDLHLARRFARDSVPLTYQVDPVSGLVARDSLGAPIVASWRVPRYGAGVVRSRRLQVEDWLAVLFFNHLFSGADAYVAAQLWDLPDMIGLQQTPFGPAIAATLRFGRASKR